MLALTAASCAFVLQLLWLLLGFLCMKLLRRLGYLSHGAVTLRMKAYAKLNMVRAPLCNHCVGALL